MTLLLSAPPSITGGFRKVMLPDKKNTEQQTGTNDVVNRPNHIPSTPTAIGPLTTPDWRELYNLNQEAICLEEEIHLAPTLLHQRQCVML